MISEDRPSTLGALAERLGLARLHADPDIDARAVSGVAVHELLDPPHVAAGTIVLGAGIGDPVALAGALRRYGAQGAAAIVVREGVVPDETAVAAAEQTGMSVLAAGLGLDWIRLASYITDTRVTGPRYGVELEGAPGEADLFVLANEIADAIGGPVTIESPTSRILAFSADQAHGDDARQQSVLGHQVPPVYADLLASGAILHRVRSSPTPVFLPSLAPGIRPRVAMRIHAGNEELGSIWAIVDEPPTDAQAAALMEGAAVASVSLFRRWAAADSARRLRVSEVLNLLEGGARAREAAERLGYGSAATVVLAAAPAEPDAAASSPIDEEAALQRLADAFGLYLHQIHPLSVAAPVGGTVYAVLPRTHDRTEHGFVRTIVTTFAERYRGGRPIVVGIGSTVDDVSATGRSRREADRALRVLRSTWRTGRRVVADGGEVQVESLLLRLADALEVDRESVTGPLAVLAAHDADHATEFVPSLRAWLDGFGDVAGAARSLHVHANTLRYRMRRIADIAEIDLDDPEVRFNLMLQLRLFRRLGS